MTWELLCRRKARQEGHPKLPLGNAHVPIEAAGELGAKEPPQAVKLYLMNQDDALEPPQAVKLHLINQDDLGFGGM